MIRTSTLSISALLLLTTLSGSAGAAPSPAGAPGRAAGQHRREAAHEWLRRHEGPAPGLAREAMKKERALWDAFRQGGSTGQTGSLSNMSVAAADKKAPPPTTWKEVGPAPLDTSAENVIAGAGWSPASGRVTAIAVNPKDPKIVYVGTAVGGVWKSTDGGAKWTPIGDLLPSLAVGAITMDPQDPEKLWVGSGSGEPYSGPSGRGLYFTADGGQTWSLPAGTMFSGLSISRIVIDPLKGDMYLTTLFGSEGYGDICSTTDLYREGQGLYHSPDGGLSWEKMLEGGFDDVEVDFSVEPAVIYADEVFAGLRRSEDGGLTWANVAGLPTMTERVQVTIAPSDPNIVYAGVGYNGEGSLWVSPDKGLTWKEVPGVPSYCEGQCFFDNTVAIKPDDPATVYLGGALCSVWKITDAMGDTPGISAISQPNGDCGVDFANWYLGFVHPDAHAMAFAPDSPDTLYVGTDGGLSRTPDGGATWEQLNEGVGTIQFYAICADPNDPVRLYGGSQDNGAMMRAEDGTRWMGLSTGDGSGCAVDASDSNRVMLNVQYGAAFVTTDLWKKKIDYTFDTQEPYCAGLAGCGDRAGFVPPSAGHPTVAGAFFIGTYRLWRSLEAGKMDSWEAISPDLTAGVSGASCVFGGTQDDYLTAIGLSANTPTTMITGSAAGVVSITTDDGATWARIGQDVFPPRWVSGFAIDPLDPKVFSVGFSGFDATTPDRPGHVFRTTDGGATWTVTDSGVDLPVNNLIGHPSLSGVLYAGTDLGVMVTNDAGATWAPLGAGLPFSPVFSLAYRASTRSLYAATFGRSAWETTFSPTMVVAPEQLVFEAVEGVDPAPQTVSVADEEPYGSELSATAQGDVPWIAATGEGKAGGSTKLDIVVTVSVQDKPVGEYDGSITVTTPDATPASVKVPVHLKVISKPKTGEAVIATGGGGFGCSVPGAPRETPSWPVVALGALAGLAARRRSSRAKKPGCV